MMKSKQPHEIAREALKRLAAQKLPPTPKNFQECYNEIANLPNIVVFPEVQLRQIALALVARNTDQQTQLDTLDVAIGRHSWQGIEDALVNFTKLVWPPHSNGGDDREPETIKTHKALTGRLVAQLVHIVESMLPALENDDTGFSDLVTSLLDTLTSPNVDLDAAYAELELVQHRLSLAAAEQIEIKETLLNLLHLVIENISKLVFEDNWLSGQIDAVMSAVKPPISLRRLDNVERRLREVMHKQAAAKERSIKAHEEMRRMLNAFIERLAEMNESSTAFQSQLEEGAKRIASVETVDDIAPLLATVLAATRTMAEETSKTRVHLKDLQAKVVATEAEIAKLHLELDNASDSARHDVLTQTLNRKGLDEALAREIDTMRRKDVPLSLALLDIDNFKKLNDRLGHMAGDDALLHLVKVVRESIRSNDYLARYGGEEFIILMPDTHLDDAHRTMVRLQRELTKNFFLSGDEKILITFSAGVAQFVPDDDGEDVIARADQAMYLAKRSGKNRVVCG